MNLGDDSSPPTYLPRDPDHTFDNVRGARDGNETVSQGHVDATLPTFIFRPQANQDDGGADGSGPFTVIRRIGRGGFGEVWEAVQTSLNRRVAIKQLHIQGEDEEEKRELNQMFRREAFTTAALDHPNIVPVYDYGKDEEGRPVLAMKLVRGESWNAVIANDLRDLPPHEVLAKNLPILVDVTQAVVFAHDAGVIHRDLKPAQVMLGKYGEVLLMDWGLAVRTGDETADTNLTAFDRTRIAPLASEASSPAGTPSFMAPEQTLDDGSLIGPWTDIYLLGGILYLLLTGTRPHDAPSATAAVVLAQSVPVDDPRVRTPGRQMPDDLVALAMHALKMEPRDRIASARDFLKSLEEHISGSSKRKESIALTNRVLARIEPMPAEYATLGDCLNDLEQARLLWGENAQAAECRETLLAEQARIAIREGDLLLARVTTERLESPESRSKLHQELNVVEVERRRRERERATLRIATTALALIMIAGGTWFLFRLSEEKQFALAARDRADASRGRAEELLDFMIDDLRTQLQPVGRVDVLDAVGRQAEAYLASLPVQEQGSKSLLQRIKTTTQLARLRVDQGQLLRAEQLLDGLEALIQSAAAQDGDLEIPFTVARGQFHSVRGRVYFDQGRLKESSAAHRSAYEEFAKLQKAQPGNTAWLAGAAENRRGCADALNTLGEHGPAIEEYVEAIALYRKLIAARPDDGYAAADLSKALTRYAIALVRSGDPSGEYKALVAESNALIRQACEAHPKDKALRAEYAVAVADNSNVMWLAGNSSDLVPEIEHALGVMHELVSSDSANLDWRSTEYSLKMLLAQHLMRRGEQERAVPLYEEVHTGLAAMIEANPSNLPMCRDLLVTTKQLNEHYATVNNRAEILRRSRITLDLCFEAAFAEARLADFREPAISIVDAMYLAAQKFAENGDLLTPGPYLESARRYRVRLLELEPDNTQRWDDYVGTMGLLTGMYTAQKDRESIAFMVREFRDLAEVAPAEVKGSEEVLIGMFIASLNAGDMHVLSQEWDKGEKLYGEAEVDLLKAIELKTPELRGYHLLHSQVLRRRASIAMQRKDIARAKEIVAAQQAAFDRAIAMPKQMGAGYQLAEDYALVGLLATKARLTYLDLGREAAEPRYDEVIEATEKFVGRNDVRMNAFRAIAMLYVGRTGEAMQLIEGLREAGDLPDAVTQAIEETEDFGPQ